MPIDQPYWEFEKPKIHPSFSFYLPLTRCCCCCCCCCFSLANMVSARTSQPSEGAVQGAAFSNSLRVLTETGARFTASLTWQPPASTGSRLHIVFVILPCGILAAPVENVLLLDCSKDPRAVEETFAILRCPANVTGPEMMVQDLGCFGLKAEFAPQCKFNMSVKANCTSLRNCTTSTCKTPSPVGNLTLGERTNSSVVLHWQNPVDCCSMASEGNFINCTAYISGLLAGQDYAMTVYTTLDGRLCKGTSTNMTTMPSPVLNVTIENRTVDSLRVRWAQPSDHGADSYRYKVCVASCNDTFKSPLWVTGLEAGVAYSVVVYAVTVTDICSPGTAITAATVPRQPRNIRVTSYSTHNLSISWDPPADRNSSQYLYWVSWFSENATDPLWNGSTCGTNHAIDNLQAGNLYQVKLASEINGIKSKEAIKWTLTAPFPPTNFRVKNTTQTTAELAWETLSSDLRGFKLQWKNLTESKEHDLHLDHPSTRTALLSGLTPSTNYTFTISSVAEKRDLMTYSIGVQRKGVTKPEYVRDVKCQALRGGHSLELSWICPSREISGLKVLVSGKVWGHWPSCKESMVIRELQPATRYWIEVETCWYNQHVSQSLCCPTDSAGIIGGSLFAGLILLVILGLLLFYFMRQRKPTDVLEKQKPDMGLPPGGLESVSVLAFSGYCCEHFSDSGFGFAMEYQQLQDMGIRQPQSVAEEPENRAKNRYSNVLPYDHSRVQLSPRPGDPSSDYINASYMPGYEREKEFIAAQGPLPGTVYDFWRMIWEQQVVTLVMLTNCIENGRVKCERYWPLDYIPCTYGDITVSVVTETILSDWTIRDFSIKRVNVSETRLARHYHYTSWPDHGVPHVTSTILHFRDLVREHIEQHNGSGPTLVHCSAGVGRTGTFIALDSLLRQAWDKGEIGGFSFVQRLRANRPLMIQNESQYIFLHRCLLDGIQPAIQNDSEEAEYTAVYENTLALQDCEVTRM
ncbi:receptor-type tyrosine-protein phosphatase H [Elgaria multicarinata webbii]|uniref:receptor-type tyrosine-protein phosphatase H n=1 Tax=Elgaria multicarinata webbii TaxID=159646 RepID=UPI002FCD0F85